MYWFRISYPIEQKLREKFHGLVWTEVLTKHKMFLSITGERRTVKLYQMLRNLHSSLFLVNLLQKLSDGKMRVVLV